MVKNTPAIPYPRIVGSMALAVSFIQTVPVSKECGRRASAKDLESSLAKKESTRACGTKTNGMVRVNSLSQMVESSRVTSAMAKSMVRAL